MSAPSASLGRESMAEFTFKAVITGVILGVIFGAASAYIGLKVGITISSSIPAAVLTIAIFRMLRRKFTILEANMSQTVASESTALATGTIFTIPALYMWGQPPTFFQITILCFLGGLLGIAAMIPLRRPLIVDADKELPYPEGRACAEVLRAGVSKSDGGKFIFIGILAGMVIKFMVGLFQLIPKEIALLIPGPLPNLEIGLEIAPAIVAVGFILGYRQSAVILAGAALASFAITPLITIFGSQIPVPVYPETKKLISEMDPFDIWSKYIRYIGAGAVAFAGIYTLLTTLPTMGRALAGVFRGLTGASAKTDAPTDRDLPAFFIVGALLFVVLLPIFLADILGGKLEPNQRIICSIGIGILGILFVAVAARIVGLVGVTSQPTSGILLMTLLVISTTFVWFGWTGPDAQASVLCVGTIVCIAASKSGDAMQDMKTGYLVGASPRKQQMGQIIGISACCWAIAATMIVLGETYGFGEPPVKDGQAAAAVASGATATAEATKEYLKAPQATLMKTILDGVMNGQLPWGLVLSGAGISLVVIMCGIGGLAFAIGLYLPFVAMFPIFLGGVARAIADKMRGANKESDAEKESNSGVLMASGLVAGEGLAGVLVAGSVALSRWKMENVAKEGMTLNIADPSTFDRVPVGISKFFADLTSPWTFEKVSGTYLRGTTGDLVAALLIVGVGVILIWSGKRKANKA